MSKKLKEALVIIGFAILMFFSGFMAVFTPANTQAAEKEIVETSLFSNYSINVSSVILNAISDEQIGKSIKVPAIQKIRSASRNNFKSAFGSNKIEGNTNIWKIIDSRAW